MSGDFLTPSGSPHAAYLVHGDDAGLVSQELSNLLDVLMDLDDEGIAPLEEYGEASARPDQSSETVPLGPILDACRTPPLFSSRRIVVVRDLTLFDTSQLKELAAYLDEPSETAVLVLVSPGKRAPALITKAVAAQGLAIDPSPPSGARARSEWFAQRIKSAPVRPDHAALELLEEHLGEDVARLEGILGTLETAYGAHAKVSVDDVTPFLGSAGSVAPWELTDAIDAGDVDKAVRALDRMLGPGMRSPFQVLATLHRHFGAMLRLEGSDATNDKEAAELTGMNPFPAGKALRNSRRLGHDNIARAIVLLADADVAMRGESGRPDRIEMEILVARLARISSSHGTTRPHSRRTRNR
ncbi:MAG: DNA polymerase III subunit delta [Acidimicrobiales bacterium]